MADADYSRNLFSPVKFGQLEVIHIEWTSTTASVATQDVVNSSPATTVVKNNTGIWDMTFPKGQFLLPVSGNCDINGGDPGANPAEVIIVAANAAAGTAKAILRAPAGSAANPSANGTRLMVTMLVGKF